MNIRKSSRVLVTPKNKKDSIYLMFRIKNGESYYVVPGGGLEDEESFEDAARREILEELGVTLSNLKLIHNNDDSCLFISDELKKDKPTGIELKNLDLNNYYEIQIHKFKDIDKLNLKPDFYKQIIKNIK